MDIGILEKDYLHVVCNQCQMDCAVEFVEFDGTVPIVKITCPHHGAMGPKKLFRATFAPKFPLDREVTEQSAAQSA